MSGESFILRTKLARLADHHGVPSANPVIMALAPPSSEDLIVEGLASTSDVDATAMKFAPRALSWTGNCQDIPLLVRHDGKRIAGQILQLRHIAEGLWVKARVSDPEGRRMAAFSIGGRVDDFILHNEGSRDFYGEVTRSTLLELSLTDRPANARALIVKRYPVPRWMRDFERYQCSVNESFDLQAKAVNVLSRGFDLLADGLVRTSDPQPQPRNESLFLTCAAPLIYGKIPPRPSKSRTEFGRLADELNQREA